MPKLKLDNASALAAQCEPGKRKTDHYDTTTIGLILEVRATGGATFYFRWTDEGGRQRQHKIGARGDVTVAEARKVAQRLRADVVMGGGDPGAKRREARAVPTYGELAAQHADHARTYMRSFATLDGYLRRIVARFGRSRLTDIETRDVAAWLAQLRAQGLAPATVEKTRVTFHRSFELGAQWGVPGADRNPVRGVPRPRFSNARERFLTAEEAARLMGAAGATRNPLLPAIVRLLLLTGMRVSELLSARWADLDVGRRSLFVPTSKTGRSRHVPLSGAALDVVTGLPRADGAVWLFPNPRDSRRHLTTIKHAFESAREAAGLPGVRIHDLRHSAASAMVAAGVDLFAVGKVLGHASYQSTQRYAHLRSDTLLAAVEAGAAELAVGV